MSNTEFDLSTSQKGIVLVDKPAGWTSFDVVAKIRGQIKASYVARGEKPTKRQLKVGHAGTLDPFATGLLLILLGNATKLSNDFLKLDKVYMATIKLGETSTTGDPEGDITAVGDQIPTLSSVGRALDKFTGTITQTPPAFSAIKINGQRAYKLAREGKAVEIPARQVKIHSLELISYEYPLLKIRTNVSSGTYIRTLAEDIGNELNVGAYCLELRRLSIGTHALDVKDGRPLEI